MYLGSLQYFNDVSKVAYGHSGMKSRRHGGIDSGLGVITWDLCE